MGESVNKVFKKRIGLVLTKPYLEALDYLVEEGFYLGHQVAIRDGMRLLFRHHKIEPFYSDLVEEVIKLLS